MFKFNVRVYGLLINAHQEILISDEEVANFQFSKFPGGGLEFGEGTIEGLKREFKEECDTEIQVLEHFYTTDFFEKSHFNDSQILSIYYKVINLSPLNILIKEHAFDFSANHSSNPQSFRWISLKNLRTDDVTFKTDKRVVEELINSYQR